MQKFALFQFPNGDIAYGTCISKQRIQISIISLEEHHDAFTLMNGGIHILTTQHHEMVKGKWKQFIPIHLHNQVKSVVTSSINHIDDLKKAYNGYIPRHMDMINGLIYLHI
jgi:hypothetical protein